MDLVAYVKKHGKTHVIFDFDATLFLLVLPWSEYFSDELKQKLVSLDASIWDQYQQGAINFSGLLNEYVKNHGTTVKRFLDEHSESFEREGLVRYEPNTDLLESLEHLDHCKKYVWTSNMSPTINAILEETGLGKHFEKVVTRSDVELIKPNPAGFELIYDGKTDKSKYLMVGDSSSDKGAAEAAGIDFCLSDFFDLRH